jgi:glycosyltransferase involved in cell wall biosynthesis
LREKERGLTVFSSTIIATIARPTLSRAVWSVLRQEFTADDFEVVVVNDSGQSLTVEDWQNDSRVQVVHTNRRGPQVAQNVGAALARGHYLHFLDDDDWLLPGAMSCLWHLSRCSQEADWLYGATQLLDRTGQSLIQLRHEMNGNIFTQAMAGEWIPLQSSFIKAHAFMAIGGMNTVPGVCWDVDLCRRIALRGAVAGTDALVVCHETGAGSSMRVTAEPTRAVRENILDERGVFGRLRHSATSSYWRGRMARAYLTSMLWNFQHWYAFAAARRALFGAMSVVAAGADLAKLAFWKGLLFAYDSQTFQRGVDDRARKERGAPREA